MWVLIIVYHVDVFSDEERRRKVKRVYADLSSQEGECRALKRQKDWASK